ncbi:MAG: hypothetical protein MUF36_05390 [Bacteroidales bacterium]|jgi:hypothetical protein|nr:hypothetical protein [Bacteroidales bacterium]
MKRTILLVILSIPGIFLFAQSKSDTATKRPLNNFNLNLLGEASLISFNYERLLFISPKFFLTGQLGIGYNEEFQLFDNSPPEKYTIISHHITGNYGKMRHFFEFGLFGAIVSGKTDHHYLLGPVAGYRIQPLSSGKINIRIYGNIPVLGFETEMTFIPVGISFGLCF